MKLTKTTLKNAIERFENYYKGKPETPENTWGISKDYRTYYVGTPESFIEVDGCYPYWKKPKVKKNLLKEVETKINSFSAMSLVKTLNDFTFNPDMFIPMLGDSMLDGVFSDEGGVLPACNYIVIGDPGAGKTTVMADYIGRIPKRKCFISAEMSPRDLKKYGDRMPHISGIPTIFFSEIFAQDEEPNIWQIIEEVFMSGQQIILLDSLAEILGPVCEQEKWSYAKAERKFVELMLRANREFLTSFIIIQQVTKGGNFVGTNKLKHNTTGMLEVRKLKGTEKRKVFVEKNRSGFKYESLEFHFDNNGVIVFDEDALKRQLLAKEFSNNQKEFDINKFFSTGEEDDEE